MGAYLSRLENVHVCIMSDSESINTKFDVRKETSDSLDNIYKVKSLIIDNFETMFFTEHYQNIRDKLFKIKCELIPDIIFCTSLNSIHPDHEIIAKACESIFIESTVYAYEPIRSAQKFKPDKWIKITREELDIKIKAISCYKSQSEKDWMKPKVIESLAICNGALIDHEYAESFEIIREVD